MLPDTLLNIGPFTLHTFGLFLGISYLLGVFVFWRLGRREGFSSDDLFDLVLLSSFFALLGGRVFHIFFFGRFEGIESLFRVGEGLLWSGGFIFALAAASLFIWVKKWSFFRISDIGFLGLAIGQSVGFLGASFVTLIPFGFYLSLGYAIVFGVLSFLRSRFPLGTVTFSYLILSSGLVALAEWLRPQSALFSTVNVNYAFSLLLLVSGVLGLIAKLVVFKVERDTHGR